MFGSYRLISKLSGRITAKSPLRIGAGRETELISSDLPIIKNSNGVPIIPGSSLKGFVRGNLERLSSTVFKENSERLLKKIFGGSGENEWASAVLFHDLKAEKFEIIERPHIAIDPEKQSVRNLFYVECVTDGSVFSGDILTARNLSPRALAILYTVISAANLGIFRLGGFKSRGYGEVEIKIEKLRFIIPSNKTKGKLSVDGLIGLNDEEKVEFELLDGKVRIGSFEVQAKISENIAFFGPEILIEGENINKVFQGLLEGLK